MQYEIMFVQKSQLVTDPLFTIYMYLIFDYSSDFITNSFNYHSCVGLNTQ